MSLVKRGEKIAYLALTDYAGGKKPLMRPAFLGQKWPTIDYYAELEGDNKQTPVALFQVKTTGKGVDKAKKSLPIKLKKEDAKRLARIPLPAYVIGVCELSRRVGNAQPAFFVRPQFGVGQGFNGHLPSARGNAVVSARQICLGDLEIERWLPKCLVFGEDNLLRRVTILRIQTDPLASFRIHAVKLFAAFTAIGQTITSFHRHVVQPIREVNRVVTV